MNKNTKRILFIILLAVVIFVAADWALDLAMMRGVNNYYGLNQNSDVLLIGHSHLMLATDKQRLEKETGLKVSKYCREGVNVTDRETMIDHFLHNGHADSLKTVLYGVDLYTFTGSGLSKNSYQLFYPFIDNADVDKYLRKEASPTDYWLHKLVRSTRFNNDGLKNSVWRGWADNWDNFKTNTLDAEAYGKRIAKNGAQRPELNDTLISTFKRSVDNLTKRGVKVVLVNTPTIDILNKATGEDYERVMNVYREMADKNPLIDFWDFNPKYAGDHSIFSDAIHLNTKGQEIVTTELIERLNNQKSKHPRNID